MLNEMLGARHDLGRTFMVAMWLLGGIAALQIVAVGWAVVTRPQALAAVAGQGGGPGSAAGAAAPTVAPPATPAVGAIVPQPSEAGYGPDTSLIPGDGAASITVAPPGSPAAIPSVDPSLPGAAAPLTSVQSTGAPGLPNEMILPGPSPYPGSEAINGAAEIENPAHTISHPVARRMLDLAREYRASGNMQAALRSLRDANTLSPNHPLVLSELASTYTQMGLDEKAAEFWRSVYVLGPERAGAFYDLADMALKGNRIEEAPPIDSVLSVGEVEVLRSPNTADGERLTLRIPIRSRPGSAPSAADMAMLVYFYDTVNGGDHAPTTATTSEQFVSAPYDWNDGGVEVIEESYFQPTFTEVQKKELGERKYFGYIIELYYQDELQDVVAEPRKLMGLKPGEPDAALLPDPDSETAPGPGAELFPRP